MKRRTFISLLAVLGAAGVVQLSGCSASNSTAAGASSAAGPAPVDLLEAIQTRGTLVVATEGAWSPWTYHDESDKLVGYDVEVATALAEKLGVKAEFVEGAWDGLFAGLDSGRYDMVCNGVELTEERALTYDFTVPYGYIHTALAVRSDNTDITTFEDLAGKTTANSIASTYMTLAESYGAEVLGIDTLDETIQMLVAGRVDATLNADVSFYDYLNVHPEADFKIVALTEDASQVCIPVRKGEETATLLAALNEAIEELRADGTLAEISQRYFGTDISSES
ncbi:MAG TPA: transporter substrate-binding domain-containing protein [Candidatus Faecalibacterium intestinipullorum]|nr:transporter substrate-binding domain-containing protein [Candidatus Faecalibacterium intestinipullorum]